MAVTSPSAPAHPARTCPPPGPTKKQPATRIDHDKVINRRGRLFQSTSFSSVRSSKPVFVASVKKIVRGLECPLLAYKMIECGSLALGPPCEVISSSR